MSGKSDLRFQMKQQIKQAVQNFVLPVCYKGSCGRKVDPWLVIFADAHHNSRPAAMELLYRKLKKEGCWRIVEHYLDYGTAGAAQVARHSMRFMQLYARAGFVVICDNFLPVASCRKKEETKVIQLWHACGSYKKFGYDAEDDIPAGYRGANVYRNTSLMTVSGEAAVLPFTSAMRLETGIVRAMGVSRTDLYTSRAWQRKCIGQFRAKYPKAAGKKVVLWAPTFRGNAGRPEYISMDVDALQSALGPEYFVIVKLHPHMQKAIAEARKKGQETERSERQETERSVEQETERNAGQDTERNKGQETERYKGQVQPGRNVQSVVTDCKIPTEELYPVVDVLIADYSSLIYEYLLFGRNVVLYVPDLEKYRAERGFYMDITEIPGEIVMNEDELPGAVKRAAEKPYQESISSNKGGAESGTEDGAQRPPQGLRSFMKRYMGACDGHATERIAEWMRLQNGNI